MNCENQVNYKPKSRFVFILLALFFNSIGLHWFYIGRAGFGVITLFYNFVSVFFLVVHPNNIVCGYHNGVSFFQLMYIFHWVITLFVIAIVDRDANSVNLQ